MIPRAGAVGAAILVSAWSPTPLPRKQTAAANAAGGRGGGMVSVFKKTEPCGRASREHKPLSRSGARTSFEPRHGEGRMPPRMRRVVGVAGFEPTASSSRTKRATRLRHAPTCSEMRPEFRAGESNRDFAAPCKWIFR